MAEPCVSPSLVTICGDNEKLENVHVPSIKRVRCAPFAKLSTEQSSNAELAFIIYYSNGATMTHYNNVFRHFDSIEPINQLTCINIISF